MPTQRPSAWHPAPCIDYNGNGLCCADLTGDGVVDQDDLGMFLDALMGDCAGACTEYRSNSLSDLSALQTPLGVVVTGGLQAVSSANNDICTKKMNLTFGGSNTSPVKVRLSRKAN